MSSAPVPSAESIIAPAPRRTLRALRRDPITFMTVLARSRGDIAPFRLGPQRFYLLSHPDHVHELLVAAQHDTRKGIGLQRARVLLGDGLLTSEGDLHLRQRRLAQPAFHRRRIAAYADVMARRAAETRARLEPGGEVDMAREMMRLTLGIAGETLFGADVEGEAAEIGAALTDAFELFDLLTMPFAPLLLRLPLPSTRRFERARDRLDATIYRMIDERRAAGRDDGDLLSMLLAPAADGGPAMDATQVRDEAMTLFLAGHETTANALTWTWYLLSQHPEVEERLHAELDAVLGGQLPAADDLSRLQYTGRVVSESMRLFPPAWIIGRQLLRDREFGDFLLPRGAVALISPYLLHHDARFWPEPGRFDPDRFAAGADGGRHKHAYLPFGVGNRQCIGNGFATTETTLVLATIAQRLRFRLVPGHDVALEPRVTLRPRYGMQMLVEGRPAMH